LRAVLDPENREAQHNSQILLRNRGGGQAAS
jgi:hypothetical protein